jgi:cytochrome c oxidase cbb3-type subunit 3
MRALSIVLTAVFLPLATFAQEAGVEQPSVFSNSLFNALSGLIILLLIIIVALSQALKNIAHSDYLLKKAKEKGNTPNVMGMIALFMFISYSASAQGKDWQVGGLQLSTFYFMVTVIILELIVMFVLLKNIRGLLKSDQEVVPVKPKESTIFKKLTAAVEIEHEGEIMLDHNYDGIRELDNDLPPWWKYGFYVTIFVAVLYLIHYHVIHTGDLQITEYNKEVEKGKQDVVEYMKNAASNVDETTVKMLGGADLESGKTLFISTCAACHGKLGEGGVGPNLTDEYWVHGGGIVDIFKTVKYGWADKGMKSWKEDLSPMQIAQVASFVRTLKGTNPANPKAPQGDLYKDEGVVVSDSLKVAVDSLSIVIPDSLKKIAVPEKK